MISIRKEADEITAGKQPKENNLLKNAPHPLSVIVLSEEEWNRCVLVHRAMCRASLISVRSPYSRQTAAYPMPWLLERKFWPTTSRIDDAYGDLHLIVSHCFPCSRIWPLNAFLQCDCPSVEETASSH